MSRNRWPLILLVLALAGGSLFAIWKLFDLRVAVGDVYPPYSSLRTDPLGAKALYETWRELGFLQTDRHFHPLNKITAPEEITLIYAGATTGSWEKEEAEQLEAIMNQGGRVILTFLPQEALDRAKEEKKAHGESTSTPTPTPAATPDPEELTKLKLAETTQRWGFTLTRRATARAPVPGENPAYQLTQPAKLEAHSMQPDIEPTLSWHTALAFSSPSEEWQVLYRCEGAPVIMERPFGNGTFVVSADSYFLSNEALRLERAPELLSRLLGGRARVIFDEHHLGVEINPGLAALVRRYHLAGLVLAFVILGALFVWQTMSPLLPPRADQVEEGVVSGRDSTSGFISLLRRGVPPGQLIRVCLDQWKSVQRPAVLKATLPALESTVAATGHDPAAAYREIHRLLTEKPKWTPAQTKSETR